MQEAVSNVKEQEIMANRKYIKNLLKTLYFMVRKKWDNTDNLEELLKFLGNDLEFTCLREHLKKSDITYLSAGSVDQLLTCISNKIESDTLNTLNNEVCFAIMADETCDEGNLEQFAVYCKIAYEGSTEHYLGIIQVENNTAEGLMTALSDFLIAKGIGIKKAMFVAFDGCNTVSGSVKGVQRLFTHQSVFLLYVNCRNHKLALCFKHLIKKYKEVQETDSCLVSFSNLFEYSAQRSNIVRNVQNVKGQTVLMPVKPSVTRWLSHKNCCIRMFDRN